eukprot:s644_g6.t1
MVFQLSLVGGKGGIALLYRAWKRCLTRLDDEVTGNLTGLGSPESSAKPLCDIRAFLQAMRVWYFVTTAPPLPQAQCSEIVTFMDVIRGKLACEYEGSFVPVRGFHSFTYCRTTESGSTDAMTSDTPRRDLREVEAERVSKLEQRAIYMAEKQAELQIMQELRCRKQEDKTQALKRQCEAQLQSVQQARREAAAKRTARRQEVSSRAKELQDGEATAREAKVNGLDARRAQAISRLRAEQAQRLEAQKSDKSSKSKELAERLKYVEEQRESAIQQKLRAYEAADAK